MSGGDELHDPPGEVPEMRAGRLLRVPAVWITPVIVSVVLIFLMTLVYVGSVVDPLAHLSGLPVLITNRDTGASVGGQQLNIGQTVESALEHSHAVTSRLSLDSVTLAQARDRMDVDGAYLTIVIPPDFTRALLAAYGLGGMATHNPSSPTIQLVTNPRSGSIGVNLATGVAQPALKAISSGVEHRLSTLSRSVPGAEQSQAGVIAVTTTQYRPLPPHSALGLSAFYISLLSIMCGFLGAVLVNSMVDAALGYSVSEVGPKWHQRPPMRITRWQTLLAKWLMSIPLVPLLTGVMLLVAVGILHMDAPYVGYLWLYTSFAAVTIALGTLALFAALGSLGQLAAILLFVYLALASSGGTVPLEALPPFFRFAASFEPLRQILDGVRALLYFNGSWDAGLSRALVLTGVGLLLWVVVGVVITKWYDRRGMYRMHPDVLEYVNRSVKAFGEERASTETNG